MIHSHNRPVRCRRSLVRFAAGVTAPRSAHSRACCRPASRQPQTSAQAPMSPTIPTPPMVPSHLKMRRRMRRLPVAAPLNKVPPFNALRCDRTRAQTVTWALMHQGVEKVIFPTRGSGHGLWWRTEATARRSTGCGGRGCAGTRRRRVSC